MRAVSERVDGVACERGGNDPVTAGARGRARPGPRAGQWDPEPVADGIEVGRARFAERSLGVEICLFGLDGSDDAMTVVTAALFPQPWEWIVIVEEYAMNAPICLSRWSTWCAVA